MKKSGCLPLLLFVVLGLSLFGNLLLFLALGSLGSDSSLFIPEKKFKETMVLPGKDSTDKVALIRLDGLISYGHGIRADGNMVDEMKEAFQQAENDPHVKAVILSVDSPGGEVTAGDTIHHALQKLQAKKPVVIFMNSIGTSAAYYIACAGSWIMCSDTTFTGSIGVIISTLNYKELFGKIGLQSVIFKSGKFKDALNGARDLTEEEKTYFQGLVMQTYERFLGIVASARKLDPAQLRDGIADGRVMSGRDAYAAKLVDQLGYIEDAYAKARQLGDAPEAQVVRYKRTYSLDKFFRIFGESRASKVELALPGQQVTLMPGRVYLLPAFFAQ